MVWGAGGGGFLWRFFFFFCVARATLRTHFSDVISAKNSQVGEAGPTISVHRKTTACFIRQPCLQVTKRKQTKCCVDDYQFTTDAGFEMKTDRAVLKAQFISNSSRPMKEY